MTQFKKDEIRQIHLDFHTPGFVPVGERFDVKGFYDTLEASRVNSLSFFAKCHHGYSYFPSKIGSMHPGLSFDMFGEAAAEAEVRDIDFLAYFSLNVDEVIAEKHPEWIALRADGSPVDSQILQDGSELYWRWLCPNKGGYLEEFFFPHVKECLARYKVGGIFIDMAGYLPGSCYCEGCLEGMRQSELDPYDEIQHNQFNSRNMQLFAARLREIMDNYCPGMRLEIGCFNAFGEASKAPGVISEFYVESLPFQTGWFNFPVMGRYLSNFGIPVTGMTGRFLRNWGDFGTIVSPHQLKIQLAEHLSIGAASCIGDHMHCNGQLESAVYAVVEEGFRFIEERQPYCVGMERAREIAIVVPAGVETNSACSDRKSGSFDIWNPLYGTAKLLMEGHYQWDVISADMPFDGLKTLVLVHPFIDEAFVTRLRQFVESGGNLLVDTAALLVREDITPCWHQFLGLDAVSVSPHPGAFYRVTDQEIADGLLDMAHYVHAPSIDLKAADEATELAKTFYPPCVRSRGKFYGHFHGADCIEGGPAVLSVDRGAGKVVVLGQSVLAAYLNTGYHAHRTMFYNLIHHLMPGKMVHTNAPSVLEITVGYKNGHTVLQFIPFIADRRHRYSFESLNDRIPIMNVRVTLLANSDISRLIDPLSQCKIEFCATPDGIEFVLPEVVDHTLILAQ